MKTTLVDCTGKVQAVFELDSSFGCKRQNQLRTVRADSLGNWRMLPDVYASIFSVKWDFNGEVRERKFIWKGNAEKFINRMIKNRHTNVRLDTCEDGLHQVWDVKQ